MLYLIASLIRTYSMELAWTLLIFFVLFFILIAVEIRFKLV
jgi:hypothetical protein